ncbi:MAG: gluconate 2-dehydrogenase subunit 3 family protein [Acidobacteria bacterium]|nr:gluconate 2-dehydrogenase subunit 3 family protein [Acidobacteriota bacterium]
MEREDFRSHYSGYDVLDKWSSPDWDDQTREVIRRRLENVPVVRFFTEQEVRTLTAIVDRILPQSDRSEIEKVPIVPWIDEKLHEDRHNGYRYEELPPQRQAWRWALAGIDETARALFAGKAFCDLDVQSQDVVLRHVERGTSPGDAWKIVPAQGFFTSVLVIAIVQIYYAHPIAWNEIGYNGPSSPRGHVRKWEGGVDPWEAQEDHD